MKVPYKVILWGDEAGKDHNARDVYNIEVLDGFDYCCDKMREAWEDDYIGFGEKEFNFSKITEVGSVRLWLKIHFYDIAVSVYLVIVILAMVIFAEWFSSLSIQSLLMVLVALGLIGGFIWSMPQINQIRNNNKRE